MTNTEFFGLMIQLVWALWVLIDWLKSWRATPTTRRKKLWDFRIVRYFSANVIAFLALSFILLTSNRLFSLEVVGVMLALLLLLGIAINELRITFQAKIADPEHFPPDSST